MGLIAQKVVGGLLVLAGLVGIILAVLLTAAGVLRAAGAPERFISGMTNPLAIFPLGNVEIVVLGGFVLLVLWGYLGEGSR